MGLETMAEAVVAFIRANQEWAAPIAFILAFGESLAFVSLIIPATAILVAIAGLLGASGLGSFSFWPVWIAAGLGGALGYWVSYLIGLYFKDSIHEYWPFKSHPYLLPRGRQFFDKWGTMGVFFGHFFGPLRAVVPVVAGMCAMRQVPFQIANFTSSFLWSAGVMAPAQFGMQWLFG